MQIPDYLSDMFASKFSGIPGSSDLMAKALAGGDTDFLSALKEFAQAAAAKAPQRQKTAAAEAAPPMSSVRPPMANVSADELALATLSPEALQKHQELTQRLDKMCNDYPGAHYSYNPDIFQKMADDPAFEEKIYTAVDRFEAANIKIAQVPEGWVKVCSMHVDKDGDSMLLTGAWPKSPISSEVGEDDDLLLQKYWEGRDSAEAELWDLIFSNEAKRDLFSAQDVCDIFLPGLPKNIMDVARAAIEKRMETRKTAEGEKPEDTAKTSAA